jgi:hypothetical protein
MAKDGHGGARLAAFALLALTLAASCRRSADDQPVLAPDKLANAIEAVREEKPPVSVPPRRLAFLRPADLARVSGRIVCTLRQRDRPLLVAGTARALARIDGRPLLLDVAGPMDASAAFFAAPRVTISIGRHTPVTRQADAPGIAWPVGVTVGGLPNAEDEKIDASWSCV